MRLNFQSSINTSSGIPDRRSESSQLRISPAIFLLPALIYFCCTYDQLTWLGKAGYFSLFVIWLFFESRSPGGPRFLVLRSMGKRCAVPCRQPPELDEKKKLECWLTRFDTTPSTPNRNHEYQEKGLWSHRSCKILVRLGGERRQNGPNYYF